MGPILPTQKPTIIDDFVKSVIFLQADVHFLYEGSLTEIVIKQITDGDLLFLLSYMLANSMNKF